MATGTKEMKTSLKNARECIKNKEYKEALKHCKAVLKLDKTNYTALVFIGKCASELDQADQALMAYRKAIESDEPQILAWQGLAALCEKENNPLLKGELPQVYTKLLQFCESDKTKWIEIASKLAAVLENQGDSIKAAELWEKIVMATENVTEELKIWLRIIKLLEKESLEDKDIGKDAYERVAHGHWPWSELGPNNELETYYENFLRFLLKHQASGDEELEKKQRLKIHDEAKAMVQLFPCSLFPLELLARHFIHSMVSAPTAEMTALFQRLCHMYPESGVGLVGLGIVLLHQKEVMMAKALLHKGLQVFSNCPFGWLALCHSQMSLHDYKEAEKSALKGLGCLHSSFADTRQELQKKLSLSRAEALQKQGPTTAFSAKDIYQELLKDVLPRDEVEILTGLGKTFLSLDDITQATEVCAKALSIDKGSPEALSLQAHVGRKITVASVHKLAEHLHAMSTQNPDIRSLITVKPGQTYLRRSINGEISFREGYFDDAELRFLEAIERCKDCASYHFLLGKLYWEMNGNLRADKKKCLAQFLKAAKLDPYHSPSFLYLGHYYLKVLKDISKASRCYQKAFDLDPSCDDAGIALGDSLMELGQEVAALNLYKNITAMSSPGKGKWAWLRLGLFHLKHSESTEAVTCFQSALRADPKDRHCWECLGEAYMSRGSYNAAMKAFTKAAEFDRSSVYCLYQLAAIKQLLCVYDEAIKEYKLILEMQPDYVPALKGLGETYLSQARSALQKDFNGKAVDCVIEAIAVLARAVQCRPGLSCLWKLIGDCCTVIHPVSDDSIRGIIPDNLKKYINGEPSEFNDKKQLLALGSSAYGRALKLQPECGTLWGDLGFNCFQQIKILSGDDREKMAHRALQALKKGLTLQPSNHILWNTLGVVTASKEINNPDLSQHSFIMSIKTEPNNVIAWTNLGVLYLKHGKIEVAHEAFKNSQALDPSYTAAWIGQATIAEIIGNEEAMDLYRHTTELGSHVEGSIGFAHWVCSSLLSHASSENRVILKGKPLPTLSHLHPEYRKAVLQSATALSKYTDRVRNNAGAYNMYGLLLENQKLFHQAEKAFESAIRLLQESENEDEQQHLNFLLINHGRVLCALGRYQEAVNRYQAVKPLNIFYDVCGLALSLFMAGQLKESYHAYEQAFQLAETDADKSCVLTAMGMLGYTLNDKEGAKAMLFKSSQLQPPCERGLMTLCALGLISSDATLAGAALGELMKRGNGNEELSGNICYLYSRFYALQGNQRLGRSHIMKEIHRNPQSSVLWSQLASYLLQACPDELQAAARCSEVSAQLGGSHSTEHNPAFHPAGIVGSGAFHSLVNVPSKTCASRRTRAGLIASQKAVHTHPDHVSSWAVLAASVAAHNIAATQEGLGRDKSSLGARISQFVESTALEEQSALRSQSKRQLPALVESRTRHLESLQSWAIIHQGYCLLYSRLLKEAAAHVDQALSTYSSIPHISAQLHFLKAQILLASEEPVEIGLNLLQTSLLSSPVHSPNAWQVLAEVQANQGSATAAELCYRQCLQGGMDSKAQSWRVVPLIRLAMLALRLAQTQSAERDRWINLSLEASNEVLKLKSRVSAAHLVQGIVYFLQDNSRASRRAFQQVIETADDGAGSAVARYWLLLLHLKKNDLAASQDLLCKAKCDGNSRLELFYYAFAENGKVSPVMRKRLIEKCIHVCPSEQFYRDLLNKIC